ncbi:MAG: DNA-3-methyladenine glycosylase 2 family protein [Deltaproteobacteria bacterium]|jgi:DNA-3-methyladenine glycosylase II|nr:DNA-3-methyladenine glycosylase 2 family protein [Deltaproteobacteria bacterium]
MYFAYGERETAYLKSRDPKLGEAMDRIGHVSREVFPDPFSCLVRLIVGQQISSAALRTVWGRLTARLGRVDPGTVGSAALEEVRSCGMTNKKASRIKDLADKVGSGAFDLDALAGLADGEVVGSLTTLGGVGRWTAEMVLIFCLQRPDVVSFGDLAILRGMRLVYGRGSIDRGLFDERARAYSPHGTVASLYLWAAAGEKARRSGESDGPGGRR